MDPNPETSSAESTEPGAIENRLSLNPTDDRWSATVGNWKDGQNYTLNNVKVRQVAPGEFEVISMESGAEEEGEAPADTTGEEGKGSATTGADDYPNPAVRRLMMGDKA